MKNSAFLVPVALALFLTLNLQPSTAHAQGTAFTYQGRLDDGGAPANGSYDFRFRLASDPLANNYAGSANLTNGIAVSNGLFTTTLDFGPGIFTGSNYWLEVDVRTNGGSSYTALSPLQALTPTPYAIMANSASNLLGALPAGQISGTIASAALPASPSFPGVVTADAFSGNGANVTNVNAATLGGLSAPNFWQLGGNNVAGGQFLGSTNNQPLELWAGDLRALRLEPGTGGSGAPNVIGGSPLNYVSVGVEGATIGGGGATNYFGSSYTNSVTAAFGTVGGGANNTASGPMDTVGGGYANQIAGDSRNEGLSVIAGGYNNSILTNADYSAIGGGLDNRIYGDTNDFGTGVIAGGDANTINSNSWNSFIGGGLGNTIGSICDYSLIGGGYNNTASSAVAVVGGGSENTASGSASVVSGGYNNTASNAWATVPGGAANVAGGDYSFAAGREALALYQGDFVWADSRNAPFVSTGTNQFLIRAAGGVGIGTNNPAAVLDVAESGGYPNFPQLRLDQQASGDYARLRFASANVPYWDIAVGGASDTMNFYYNGNGGNLATLDTNGDLTTAGTVTANGVLLTSDRNAKENFAPLDPQAVLAKVAALPVSEWNYKSDPASLKHLGPMAQDFHAAFGLNGSDDKHISVIDEGGVALAAIQGLNQKLNKRDAEIQHLKQQNEALEKRLDNFEKMIKSFTQN